MSWISDLLSVADRWKLWGRLKQAPDKIEALETRLAALEQLLETCPAECCPYCGVRAMRMDRQEARYNGQDVAGYNEIWNCADCGKSLTKRL